MSATAKNRLLQAAALAILVTLAFSVAISAGQSSRIVSEKLYNLPGLRNVGRLEPGLLRGAQPDDEGYRTLRKMGIRTVLSLRNNHDESEKVTAAGMTPVRIRMNMLHNPDKELMRQALKVLSDPALRPLYFHCALGQDRTGALAAIYRMQKQGWPRDAALAEMQDFGFNDIWIGYKKFVKSFEPEGQEKSQGL